MVSPRPVVKPLVAAFESAMADIRLASPPDLMTSSDPASAAESAALCASRLLAYHSPISTESAAAPMSTGAAMAA